MRPARLGSFPAETLNLSATKRFFFIGLAGQFDGKFNYVTTAVFGGHIHGILVGCEDLFEDVAQLIFA